jgi:hypothetical protein
MRRSGIGVERSKLEVHVQHFKHRYHLEGLLVCVCEESAFVASLIFIRTRPILKVPTAFSYHRRHLLNQHLCMTSKRGETFSSACPGGGHRRTRREGSG